jgi:hypothetical protein
LFQGNTIKEISNSATTAKIGYSNNIANIMAVSDKSTKSRIQQPYCKSSDSRVTEVPVMRCGNNIANPIIVK